jgi:hypothetical protein
MHICRFAVDNGRETRIGLDDRSSDTDTPVDVVFTGTPTSVNKMSAGDDIVTDDIGSLENQMVEP